MSSKMSLLFRVLTDKVPLKDYSTQPAFRNVRL